MLRIKTLFVLFICCTTGSLPAGAQQPSPISYLHIVRHDPNFSIHIVTIDLTDPRVSVHVCPGGPVSKADGHWDTTLLPPSQIAQRDGYDIAINGDFFDAEATHDIEGKNTGYVKGKRAAPVGEAMTDGKIWNVRSTTRPVVEVDGQDHVIITTFKSGKRIGSSIKQIMGGLPIILHDGQKISLNSNFSLARHPRTAVGVSKDGKKLILLVVDGRQPELSIGMTLSELADEMTAAGAYNAINLDGGGSSVLVMRDPATDKLRILNSPSDGKERSVADALCVKVNAPMPALP